MHTRPLVFGLLLALTLSCSDKPEALSAEDLAGEAYAVGDKVKAPFGKSTKTSSGKVRALYGKLAQVDFTSGQRGWALVKSIDPPGKVLPLPVGDTCAVAAGDKVTAPWGKMGKYYSGTIDEVHGKLAHVRFTDGDVDWALCEGIKKRQASTGTKTTKTTKTTNTSSTSGKCVFRPAKGKHVKCSSFVQGKCKAGASACKPASKCVYRPEKGKYVKCQTFTQGKCISGTRACKPASKCVYRPEKGMYVKCQTFTQGKCISGTRACKP